ncbi:MAG: hypothetical protein LBK53_00430 [Heliobacteriaceae bacterium]|jgi:hypothetical protein|nr:hypothetical protein [Heliobacteriaceae bacterium]
MVNVGKYAAKGLGALVLFVQAKDAHHYGKMRAAVKAETGDANALASAYINTQMLNVPSSSAMAMKDFMFKKTLNDNMGHFVNSVKGYFGGFATMLTYNVLPLGLGLSALLAKNKYIRGGSAIIAAAFMGLNFFKEGLGKGHSNDINPKY